MLGECISLYLSLARCATRGRIGTRKRDNQEGIAIVAWGSRRAATKAKPSQPRASPPIGWPRSRQGPAQGQAGQPHQAGPRWQARRQEASGQERREGGLLGLWLW